jgi:hypothetical protein
MSQPVSFQSYVLNSNRSLFQQCSHKSTIDCILSTTPNCCACDDKRPNAPAYPVYVDGEGIRYQGTRWGMYCWKCRGESSITLFLHCPLSCEPKTSSLTYLYNLQTTGLPYLLGSAPLIRHLHHPSFSQRSQPHRSLVQTLPKNIHWYPKTKLNASQD